MNHIIKNIHLTTNAYYCFSYCPIGAGLNEGRGEGGVREAKIRTNWDWGHICFLILCIFLRTFSRKLCATWSQLQLYFVLSPCWFNIYGTNILIFFSFSLRFFLLYSCCSLFISFFLCICILVFWISFVCAC